MAERTFHEDFSRVNKEINPQTARRLQPVDARADSHSCCTSSPPAGEDLFHRVFGLLCFSQTCVQTGSVVNLDSSVDWCKLAN